MGIHRVTSGEAATFEAILVVRCSLAGAIEQEVSCVIGGCRHHTDPYEGSRVIGGGVLARRRRESAHLLEGDRLTNHTDLGQTLGQGGCSFTKSCAPKHQTRCASSSTRSSGRWASSVALTAAHWSPETFDPQPGTVPHAGSRSASRLSPAEGSASAVRERLAEASKLDA